jgi:hypothetical protein
MQALAAEKESANERGAMLQAKVATLQAEVAALVAKRKELESELSSSLTISESQVVGWPISLICHFFLAPVFPFVWFCSHPHPCCVSTFPNCLHALLFVVVRL